MGLRLNRQLLWLVVGLFIVVGCADEPTPTVSVSGGVETAVPVEAAPAETRVLPTLFPTPTSFPTPVPTEPRPTSTPRPTATPVDFQELAVEVHFTIPGLGLSRTIRGNVSSHIELTDETTGQSVVVSDLPGVLFDMQRTLPEAELTAVPTGCDFCVQLSYELFLIDEADEGWLTDPILLASFENFLNAHLGPHFPPDTVVGLRRSATPYYVAHTVALTVDGSLWRWTATEAEANGPEAGSAALLPLLDDVILDDVAADYLGPCPEGSGVETLYLKQGETERLVELTCPELSLPLPLLPLYVALDGLAREKTADDALPQPDPTVPLESVLYYQRADGSVLILFADDRAQATTAEGLTASATLAENQAIDTTLTFTESGLVEPGVISLVSGDNDNILIGRGLTGVYEIGWNETVPDTLVEFVAELDGLLDQLLETAEGSANETSTPDPEATPGTGTPTPVEEETPLAPATATPTP